MTTVANDRVLRATGIVDAIPAFIPEEELEAA
jgi:hypothetical protein